MRESILTYDAMGKDFYISDGHYVKFELAMDGHEISFNKISLGADGWHPNGSKFLIRYDDEPAIKEYIIIDGFDWFWGWPGPHHGPHSGPPHP